MDKNGAKQKIQELVGKYEKVYKLYGLMEEDISVVEGKSI